MHCPRCDIKLTLIESDVSEPNTDKIRIASTYQCPQCHYSIINSNLHDVGKVILENNKNNLDFIIEKSIQFWKNVLCGQKEKKSEFPLCIYYKMQCQKCIIYQHTNACGCELTPYVDWEIHQDMWHNYEDEHGVYCLMCSRLINKEIKFLEDIKNELLDSNPRK